MFYAYSYVLKVLIFPVLYVTLLPFNFGKLELEMNSLFHPFMITHSANIWWLSETLMQSFSAP